jgi:hypothetical protein
VSTGGTERQIARMRMPPRLLGREGLTTSSALMQVPTRPTWPPRQQQTAKRTRRLTGNSNTTVAYAQLGNVNPARFSSSRLRLVLTMILTRRVILIWKSHTKTKKVPRERNPFLLTGFPTVSQLAASPVSTRRFDPAGAFTSHF